MRPARFRAGGAKSGTARMRPADEGSIVSAYAEVLTTMVQVVDRRSGRVFLWSSDQPLRVYVYPRQEPDTVTPYERVITLTNAALNSVNNIVSHPFLMGLADSYEDGSLFRQN